jgi:anti-anti-sigma factor
MNTIHSQLLETELLTKDLSGERKIVFDFENVIFISSYFLRVCFSTLRAAGNERFYLINVKSEVKKVFMIAGYDKLMNME